MLRQRRMHRLTVVAAAVLLLAGCAGTPSGQAVVGRWGSTSAGQPNLDIQNDGTFAGSDGCNTLSGKGQIDGDEITFGPIAATLMACENVDTWLSKAATGNVSGDTMTVLDGSGSTIGTLKRSGA
ncbi:META domain-containing protein [Leifsonia sp. 21MFCrub1.1]|uniref:META domain-containing protein n=1 Tax=Leifsonia sp. 21MFCrub1.1 TaxID=1798223 RepID=UPI00089290A8|nr:META domain-containing protein [Leifsonia sp. 21MFCrub1.1]SEA32232.1 Heat shock protein HslJ [Leifsonia sp. 21MFCrub1.1]